jgi:hypothetical protein
VRQRGKRSVGDGRTDSIQPSAAIGRARRSERSPRKLLGVKTVGTALRRILPARQCTCQCLAGKFIAETAEVFLRHAALQIPCFGARLYSTPLQVVGDGPGQLLHIDFVVVDVGVRAQETQQRLTATGVRRNHLQRDQCRSRQDDAGNTPEESAEP